MLNDVLVAAVSVVIGVVASYGLYWLLGKAVSLLPSRISQKAQVWAFVTPAVVLLLVRIGLSHYSDRILVNDEHQR